ncbi:hypothetical protein HDR58_07190 [bacterium]|nr:hypothetical protein [bacterium]
MNEVNELLIALGENIQLKPDQWSIEHMYSSGNKKWIANILPEQLLKRTVKNAIESLITLCECNEFYTTFPDNIETPNYGDKWGTLANYIEINNRAIAEMYGNQTKNGILSSIKILPAIPPSAKSWANCIILSQIFPNIYGDGYNKGPFEENSIYGIKLNANYSGNIIDYDIQDKISAEKQFKAFNLLANLHGLKTGFRTVISADQIKIASSTENDINFQWTNPEHQELFINEHVRLINTGFEAIFIDSAKHIGGYEMENYTGVGALPEYEQMQYIIHEIRKRSGNTHLSFAGEKSTGDFARYENLGLTTGTAFIEPDSYEEVKCWSEKLKYNKIYTPGVEVSNDNDEGGRSYESRLNRINSVLFGYEYPSDKLPSFMQMEDIFPLRYDTSTHHLMMTNPSYSINNTPESHWENLFTKEDGRVYNSKVAELFVHALNL